MLFVWGPALLSAAAASICAFCPGPAGFGLTALAGTAGLAVSVYGIFLEISRLGSPAWITLGALTVYALTVLLSYAGLVQKRPVANVPPVPNRGPGNGIPPRRRPMNRPQRRRTTQPPHRTAVPFPHPNQSPGDG